LPYFPNISMLSSHNSLLAALSPTPHPIPPAPLLSHLLATVYPTTQLSLIFIYLSLFNHLSATVPPSHPVPFPPSFPSLPFSLFLLTLSLVLLSHLLKSGSSFLTTGIYLTICLRGLSPLLSTLTSSYATDTIYSLSLLLLLLHLLTHDYFSTSGDGGILSLKSALFATVLLTSRIATTDPDESNYFNCFLFIFVAIQVRKGTKERRARNEGTKERRSRRRGTTERSKA